MSSETQRKTEKLGKEQGRNQRRQWLSVDRKQKQAKSSD